MGHLQQSCHRRVWVRWTLDSINNIVVSACVVSSLPQLSLQIPVRLHEIPKAPEFQHLSPHDDPADTALGVKTALAVRLSEPRHDHCDNPKKCTSITKHDETHRWQSWLPQESQVRPKYACLHRQWSVGTGRFHPKIPVELRAAATINAERLLFKKVQSFSADLSPIILHCFESDHEVDQSLWTEGRWDQDLGDWEVPGEHLPSCEIRSGLLHTQNRANRRWH